MSKIILSIFYSTYLKAFNSIDYTSEVIEHLSNLTEAQKDELNVLELEALQQNKLSLIYFLLHDKKMPNTIQEFDQFISLTKHIFKLLSFEVLNQLAEERFFPLLVRSEYSAMSLAIDYFRALYVYSNTQSAEKKQSYLEMLDRWKEEIIDVLLTKRVSVDKGMIAGRSILGGCLQFVSSINKEDRLYKLCWQLLSYVTEVNQAGSRLNGGETPLSIALKRGFPYEFIQALLDKKADINVLIYPEIGYKIRQPLLCFLIKDKNYPMLRFLLEQGADMNKMPTYESKYKDEREDPLFEHYLAKESFLTPYQLAVALGDDQAIEIMVQHVRLNNIELLSDLHEAEINRKVALHHKVKGADLIIQCRTRFLHGAETKLENIQAKWGLKVYVKLSDDRKPFTEAIDWLFEGALDSAAKRFWLPALACLKEEISTNSQFAIYLSEAPQKIIKAESCGGFFYKNIYIQSDNSKDNKIIYITRLAHEIGHLFDHKNIFLKTFKYPTNPEVTHFKLAIEKDLAMLNANNYIILANFPHYIKGRLLDIEVYYNEQNKLQDYFTTILIEAPIVLTLNDASMTEEKLLNIMHTHFPTTIKWYQSAFMKNKTYSEQANFHCINK